MKLSRRDEEMLDGRHGLANRRAMEGLVTLGEACNARGYGRHRLRPRPRRMATDKAGVELMKGLANAGATVAMPSSANIANADTVDWRQTGAPEPLARLQQRAAGAHRRMGRACSFTCTPYWARNWPPGTCASVSIESTVTIFCKSVLGARSNRDGFFAVYAEMVGRYPRFGSISTSGASARMGSASRSAPESISDFSALVPCREHRSAAACTVFEGFAGRPAWTGSMRSARRSAPRAASRCSSCRASRRLSRASSSTLAERVAGRCNRRRRGRDPRHLRAFHRSRRRVRSGPCRLPARLVRGGRGLRPPARRRARRRRRRALGRDGRAACAAWRAEAGLVETSRRAGAKVISDACPMSCHFARPVLARSSTRRPAAGCSRHRRRIRRNRPSTCGT